MFHTKIQRKMHLFGFNGAYYCYEHLTHKKYIFSESIHSKDSTGTVPKPNDTGVQIIQSGTFL